MADARTESRSQRADRLRRSVGLVLGPLIFVVLLILPLELSPAAHRLAAVFGLVIVLWVSEAIPLAATALLGPALTVPLGVASAREAFAAFGHPIIFLFLGSFVIAGAMRTHGLDRRIALFVLSRRWVGESPTRILIAFGIVWLLFNVLGNVGKEWNGVMSLIMQSLLAVPFFAMAWLCGRWPHIAGAILIAVSVFFYFFFGGINRANFDIISTLVTFLLFIGPLLASGIALVTVRTAEE